MRVLRLLLLLLLLLLTCLKSLGLIIEMHLFTAMQYITALV